MLIELGVLVPASDWLSGVTASDLVFRRLTTRFFFLRPVLDRTLLPTPKPVDALTLAKEGRDDIEPCKVLAVSENV